MERINDKIDDNIPNSQAAYRGGRSTTGQVFTIKLMAEKAITSSNYTVMLLMMDMSKAFDSIHRALILEDLRSILLPEELHMIKLMGNPFNTNIGTPQEDCLRPILFTLKCRNSRTPTEIADHNYGADETQRPMITPTHLGDHNYIKPRSFGTLIDLQYADDICWVGGN